MRTRALFVLRELAPQAGCTQLEGAGSLLLLPRFVVPAATSLPPPRYGQQQETHPSSHKVLDLTNIIKTNNNNNIIMSNNTDDKIKDETVEMESVDAEPPAEWYVSRVASWQERTTTSDDDNP